MIALGRKALADVRRRPVPVVNDTFHKGEWMETGTDPHLSPTVFLAEQPPHCELLTHFHRQNQFQLFVDGTGTIRYVRPDGDSYWFDVDLPAPLRALVISKGSVAIDGISLTVAALTPAGVFNSISTFSAV